MSAYQTDRSHFERQILFARPIFVLLALLAALEQPSSRQERRSLHVHLLRRGHSLGF